MIICEDDVDVSSFTSNCKKSDCILSACAVCIFLTAECDICCIYAGNYEEEVCRYLVL